MEIDTDNGWEGPRCQTENFNISCVASGKRDHQTNNNIIFHIIS